MSLSSEVDSCKDKAIIRLLSGPLSGCEYRISRGITLVVAQRANALTGQQDDAEIPEFPENALVLAVEGGINFELTISEDGTDDFMLRSLSSEPVVTTHRYHQSCQVGALHFSVRPIDTTWQSESISVDSAVTTGSSLVKRSKLLMCFLVAVLVLILGVSAVKLWMVLSEKKRETRLAKIVTGSSEPLQMIRGRDGQMYIFANTERDVSWARQALMREGLTESVQISTLHAEELRIIHLIQANYPSLNFHRIKLDDPAKPLLFMSEERGYVEEQTRRQLVASMMSWMAYADTINHAMWSDAMLEIQAKSGLDRLGIPYARVTGENVINYTIEGNLDDIDLAKLHNFSEKFYRDFGKHYINFSVALKEDWLKGKSFRYGISGYVKMAPQHWYFPQTF
jgi:type III secretion system protein